MKTEYPKLKILKILKEKHLHIFVYICSLLFFQFWDQKLKTLWKSFNSIVFESMSFTLLFRFLHMHAVPSCGVSLCSQCL